MSREAELLGMVAHELRNPLTPIRMVATLLDRAAADEGMLAYLRGVIERQVQHMTRLVDDLLDESRAATGKLTIEPRATRLADVLGAAVDGCRTAVAARHQSLRIDLPEVVPTLHGDPVRLTQVIGNLLDNASKFSPDGGEISVSLAVEAGEAVITVSDGGIGIDADRLSDLFEPFVQDPRGAASGHGGLGIGLAVVREIVESHGGRVSARNRVKAMGTQFVVALPIATDGPGHGLSGCASTLSAGEHRPNR